MRFLDYTVVKIYRPYCGFVVFDNVKYANNYLKRISSRQRVSKRQSNPITDLNRPEDSRRLKFPDFKTIGT